MKLLHREDVLEAGYDLPNTGLCANIGADEMEELRFGGEWILAEDETLVTDGHEQRYLYMVVSGEVAITKINDQGKSQQIATLGAGAAFGEMAFLSGGVASANVQSIGEAILWRLDHERLLGFIGEHGVAGGQLCLNVASILSGRLVDGNKKVVDMGKELQSSLAQLQQVSSAGSKKDQALRQMQGKVANMQNAFKGSSVKKSGNFFAIAASVVAFISTAGMVALFVASDDSSVREAATLTKKVEKLEANEKFYLDLKKRLEFDNQELVDKEKAARKENQELADNLSQSMSDSQDLRNQLRSKERELSEAKDDLVRAQKVEPKKPMVAETVEDKPQVSQTAMDEVLAWTRNNSTLAFPIVIEVKETAVTLQDRGGQVKIPVSPGQSVRATKFHPSSSEFLIVAQENSDSFLASMRVSNSNFIEKSAVKFANHKKYMGQSVSSDLTKALSANPAQSKQPVAQDSRSPTNEASAGEGSTTGQLVAQGKPKNPQKSENILDEVKEKEKVDTSDHGANCVCKDCRAKKIGKGGSLFPDL